MANLKFADTHNMVAFLSKPEESGDVENGVPGAKKPWERALSIEQRSTMFEMYLNIPNISTASQEAKKRAGTELMQENAKKQKVDDDKETTELKQCMEIIPDEEEVTLDAYTSWKIEKTGYKLYSIDIEQDEDHWKA
ncbi:hypothetical protein Tco_0365792 [Tanacetum coccineum]